MNSSRINLVVYDELRIRQIVRPRKGEVRIGEMVQTIPWQNVKKWKESLKEMSAKYVLVGLPEDVGVRANFGRGGAYSAWQPVLNTLLNSQSNASFTGDEIIVLGHLDFSEIMDAMKDLDLQDQQQLEKARTLVAEIDEAVYPVIEAIVGSGKEAIIVGGGHNNAYGNLKGAAKAIRSAGGSGINCINCDAHSDLRPCEGRHSGNGFTYALQDNYLQRYAMIGLQEIFNSAAVMQTISIDNRLQASWFEDIFIRNTLSFREAVDQAISFTKDLPIALELDLDIVQNIPSSAKTSSGISTLQARQYIHWIASQTDVKYLHLAEAAPVLSHIKTDLKTGKLMAFLITDYIKARNYYHTISS